MKRQAATDKGLKRRVRDLCFGQVAEPRMAAKVTYPLPTLLTALTAAMATLARSLRKVEARTGQMAKKHGNWLGVTRRIADNTFGKVLPRLPHGELMACQHRLVKAEHRRGNLRPTGLFHAAAAIDGKHVATLQWHDLVRVLELTKVQATVAKVRKLLAARYPEAQLCVPKEGEPYALVRVHTVTLISSEAAVCLHQRPIAGETNEIGALPALLDELKAIYGHTRLFRLITTDAGNTSLAAQTQVKAMGCDYFAQIKSIQGEIHAEAQRVLRHRSPSRAHATGSDQQNGRAVTYHVWRYDLGEEGYLDWVHARQLVRVQRVTEDPETGKTTVGNRYYVTSLPPDKLSASTALKLSRAHWRSENCTHWTSDAELREDRRQLSWSRHPHGVLAVTAIRMMALAILSIARQQSRQGTREETPSFGDVGEHFFLVLCASVLDTTAFDDV